MSASHKLQHIAFIMDGNRRWAKQRLMPTAMGHAEGAKTLKKIAKAVKAREIPYMTVYALSTENLNRSKEELDYLFSLFGKYGMYSKETKKNLSRFIFDNKGVIKLASRNSGVYHRITNIVLGNFFGLLLSYNLARLKSYLLLRFSNK